MKTLLLLRAGLSNPHASPADDLHRPITRRGRMDALRIGAIIQARELFPELILTSPALRARQTIEMIREKSDYIGEILAIEGLYHADRSGLLDIIGHLPDNLQRVMIVAHSPGLKQVLTLLTGWEKSLPAAGLAYLAIPIRTWREVLDLETEAVLVELWHPSKPECSYFMGFFELG
jgi:phosphohistidine phosphatase